MDTKSRQFTEQVQADIRLDLLSYLTIKAYQHIGTENNPQSIASLSNDILYPGDYKSIVDIIE